MSSTGKQSILIKVQSNLQALAQEPESRTNIAHLLNDSRQFASMPPPVDVGVYSNFIGRHLAELSGSKQMRSPQANVITPSIGSAEKKSHLLGVKSV